MKISTYGLRITVTLGLLQSILFAGLVGFWPFYENTTDFSGNGNGAINFSVTPAPDRFGNENYAYLFNGIDDYIEIADSPSLDITGELSIEAWIYIDRTTDLNRLTVLSKPLYDSGVDPYPVYALTSNDSATTWEFSLGEYSFEFGSVQPETWQHIAVTFNYGLQTVNGYQDGELVYTNPEILTDLGVSEQSLLIGANIQHGDVFPGVIDDIRLFDSALSSSQIDSLYNIPFGINQITTPESALAIGDVYITYPETSMVEIWNYGLGLDTLTVASVDFSSTIFSTD
ncbi:MAG: LamG domain-containing protein, partial [Candidatus Marinimicrobia bacterium]|nr:LamG domain-containing protein [Candidatus Neomarinimicrobiota bacterium]